MKKVKNVRQNQRNYSVAFKMKLVDEIENGILTQTEAEFKQKNMGQLIFCPILIVICYNLII